MLMRNEKAILVAETGSVEASYLGRLLGRLGHLVHMAAAGGQVLNVIRRQMPDRAVVAAELSVEGEPLLARLSRLPSLQRLIAIGPAGNADMEIRARRAGAHVYLPRPVDVNALGLALHVPLAQVRRTAESLESRSRLPQEKRP